MDERTLFLSAMARIVSALDAIGVPYVVSGSMAAGFYGTPRMSADIDFVINPRDSDKAFLAKVLAEDFFADPDVIRASFLDRSSFQVIDPQGHVKADMIFWSPTFNPADVFGRAHSVEIQGTMVQLISPEDLLISKLLWARDSHSEMQLRDVHGLLHYRELDAAYVSAQASQLKIEALMEEARSERYAT